MAIRYKRVSPGDLITADFVNSLLTALEKVEDKVTVLEQKATSTPLAITHVEPNGVITVGTVVTVHGVGFGVPAAKNDVKIGSAPVLIFKETSSATQFQFEMPPISGLTGATPLQLTLINHESSAASYPVVVAPLVTLPTVTPILAYAVAPTTLHPDSGHPNGQVLGGDVYDFGFTVNPAVAGTTAQSFLHTISASLGSSNWSVTLVDAGTVEVGATSTVALPSNTLTPLRARVKIPPSTSAPSPSATLTLSIEGADTQANIKPATPQSIVVTLGQPIPQPENRVRVSLRSASGATLTSSGVQFNRGQQGTVGLNINCSAAIDVGFSMELPQGWSTTLAKQSFNVGANTPSTLWTPGQGAVATALVLDITNAAVQPPVAVKYRIPVTIV